MRRPDPRPEPAPRPSRPGADVPAISAGAARVLADVERGDEPLSLSRAAKLPLLLRDGRSPAPSFTYRKAKEGMLDVAKSRGGYITTKSAVARMLAAMNGGSLSAPTPGAIRCQHLDAERELDAAGIR